MKKIIFLASLFILAGSFSVFADSTDKAAGLPQLLYFYSPTCHSCQKTRLEIMPQVKKDFSGLIEIEYLDTTDINNYRLMLAIKQKYNCSELGVPTMFIAGQILVGYDKIKSDINRVIMTALTKETRQGQEMLPGIDLVGRFLSFGALAVAFAGLIDGVNPCAFTVIVFFISYLAIQGYRKREMVIIGLFFILAVLCTYILIGLGIFRSLYALSRFYFVTRSLYFFIAWFSIILGVLALYDLWLYIRNKKTEGMILQLPQVIKNRIHNIIGERYRKTKDATIGGTSKVPIARLSIGAFFTGFLISLLEAVCTGQLYLPTITFVLKEPQLRLRALGYLFLYNSMFIMPLLIVFLCALFGATSVEFSRFLKRHMFFVKLLMALVFFGMGIFILRGA